MTTLNARDTALLGLLSSEASRQAILKALNHTCAQVTSIDNDTIVQFRETLAMTIRYVLSTDGLTVLDTATGLTWQQAGSDKELNEEGEKSYIAKLNKDCFGGFADWRAPNDHELLSIVDRDRYNPAIDPVFACKSDLYRTSKTRASSSDCVWIVYFGYGFVGSGHRDHYAFVRAVRGPSPAGQ